MAHVETCEECGGRYGQHYAGNGNNGCSKLIELYAQLDAADEESAKDARLAGWLACTEGK